MNKNNIGNKHTAEDKIMIGKIRWCNDRKAFQKEYKKLINEGIILRIKKRTKKGSDWHISINPRKLKKAFEITGDKT